jgi:hypothetical protein
MENRSLINTVVIAAVVFVMLPLLLAAAIMLGHAGYEVTNGPGLGMFAPFGGMHVVMSVWIVAMVVIVGALVGLLMKDTHQHA